MMSISVKQTVHSISGLQQRLRDLVRFLGKDALLNRRSNCLVGCVVMPEVAIDIMGELDLGMTRPSLNSMGLCSLLYPQ